MSAINDREHLAMLHLMVQRSSVKAEAGQTAETPLQPVSGSPSLTPHTSVSRDNVYIDYM